MHRSETKAFHKYQSIAKESEVNLFFFKYAYLSIINCAFHKNNRIEICQHFQINENNKKNVFSKKTKSEFINKYAYQDVRSMDIAMKTHCR